MNEASVQAARQHRERSGRTPRFPAEAAVTELDALSNALLLEHIFDPKTLPAQEMRHLLGVFFDAVLGTPARHHRN